MNTSSRNVNKVTTAGLFLAIAVVGSVFSFPVGLSKCAPVQHMVNILCAVLLGPFSGIAVAFGASLLRNLLGIGSILAFPGSMIGALLAGLTYKYTRNILLTLLAEVIGTGILGGLSAYPLAVLFLGKNAGQMAFYVYVVPFLVSTVGGSLLSGMLLYALQRIRALAYIQKKLGN